MIRVFRSDTFIAWLKKLNDSKAKSIVALRISRLRQGNAGDAEPIGEGCSEMRIHYGPGYRVYFKDAGTGIALLLCGGDKPTQQKDIAKAKEIAKLPLDEFTED
jgi:putative addiction module killer protein